MGAISTIQQKLMSSWLLIIMAINFILIFSSIENTIATKLLLPTEIINNDNNNIINNDFRFISYQDLLPTSDRFTDENVTSFSRLLFDVARDQVIVGARDTLYRMSFTLKPREKSTWEATVPMMETCQNKGQTEQHCHNYIMVLQNYGNQLYACGTYAYSPLCSWRQMENLNVTRYDKGVAKCPFNPNANITTLMTENGQMFVGSPTDFSGSDPAILRADVSQDRQRILRTKQSDSKWLNDPQFVGSFEEGEFIYFIFRETAVEYINCGKIVYSRIARVCKSDPGGSQILKDNWTSYVKARLNCSLPGEYPFYFDEVQGIEYSHEEGVMYATFTTPENSIHGSAICAFNISAIHSAFAGPFKHQETIGSLWEGQDTQYRGHYECKLGGRSSANWHTQLLDSTRYQLMDMAVQPSTTNPLHFSKLERFTHIALDMISTKLHESVRIIYIATENGLVKKISVLPRTKETCVIEIWQPDIIKSGGSHIRTLEFLKETESLYIGMDSSIMRISAQHCNRHVSKSSCLNSMDPYCGWNELQEACTAPPNGDTLTRHWIQNATDCPVLTAPVDGGWSVWSEWNSCAQSEGGAIGNGGIGTGNTGNNGNGVGTQSIDDSSMINNGGGSGGSGGNQDTCLCRTRSCNNPTPRNGGSSCNGMSIAVTNCTVNGGWTEWSTWSACSQTCGIAVKTRRRVCGNPKPAHGGRVCVGPDRSEMYCHHLPPCPAPKQPIDGGWGPWGQWDECSANCNGGFRIRRRKCDDPIPSNGGMDCSGCHLDYEICNQHSCAEVKKLGAWTPWSVQINGSTGDGGQLEKRYRYSCRAAVADPSTVRITMDKEQSRLCQSDGSCHRSGEGSGDEVLGWGDWSRCSVECGGGQQFRTRHCEKENCETKMARACNTHSCKGEWGCWSDWTPCSVSCGMGKRYRERKCISMGNELFGSGCEGSGIEYDSCEQPSCDSFLGWSTWTEWSPCNEEGERSRTRKCLTTNPSSKECLGNEREVRICLSPQANEIVQQAGIGTGTVLAACLLGIFVCSSVSALIMYIFMKKRIVPRDIKNIGSPCFDSFPNQYSSLPTKDDRPPKVKRQSSFNSGGGGGGGGNCGGAGNGVGNSGVNAKLLGNGTLTKSNNVTGHQTPKVLSKTNFVEVDTATIKRNSHGLNNVRPPLRSLDDDKF